MCFVGEAATRARRLKRCVSNGQVEPWPRITGAGGVYVLPSGFNSVSRCSVSVDADEIKRLGKRFKKLDLDNSGSLSVEEFMSLPELQQNPLVQRVIDIFDTDGNGEVDFKGE